MRKMYTYCHADGTIIGYLDFDEQPQYSTLKIYNGNFIKPKLNFESDEFYEGASVQELIDYKKSIIPMEVALWRIRAILAMTGKESLIVEAFSELQEPQKTAANYIWQFGTVIERYSPTVLFIQSKLQMSDDEVDDIFINANNIGL